MERKEPLPKENAGRGARALQRDSGHSEWGHAMDQGSLVTEQIEAGNSFLRKFEECTQVVVAFWLKEDEDGRWNLYVASDQFDMGKLGMAYEEVLRIAKELKDPYFEPFQ